MKDGLLKMVLFTNPRDVKIKERSYRPVPILKLTTGSEIALESLPEKDKKLQALGDL
jgi:hypothetical protein